MQSTKKLTAKITTVLVAASLVLGGCATASKDVATQSISPLQYQAYDCDQITAETLRVQNRVSQLGGRLDTAAANDKAITGIGIVLFWPALFALGGTKEQEAEYGRLKGESDALEQAGIYKKCMAPTAPAAQPVAQPATTQPAAAQVAAVQPTAAEVQPNGAIRTNWTKTPANNGKK